MLYAQTVAEQRVWFQRWWSYYGVSGTQVFLDWLWTPYVPCGRPN